MIKFTFLLCNALHIEDLLYMANNTAYHPVWHQIKQFFRFAESRDYTTVTVSYTVNQLYVIILSVLQHRVIRFSDRHSNNFDFVCFDGNFKRLRYAILWKKFSLKKAILYLNVYFIDSDHSNRVLIKKYIIDLMLI